MDTIDKLQTNAPLPVVRRTLVWKLAAFVAVLVTFTAGLLGWAGYSFTRRVIVDQIRDRLSVIAMVRQASVAAYAPVLVVDDNATNRRIMLEILNQWGMKAVVVDGAAAALDELHRAAEHGRPYPLVLVDCMMPHMDGFALAEQIRQRPGLNQSTLMMLSSAVQSEYRARSRDLGFAAYLTKPIKQSELLDNIMQHLHGPALLQTKAPAVQPIEMRADKPLHILLAEDSLVNQKLAVRLLEQWGHTVELANNGREALDALQRRRFDLVLMDVQMPEMDGFEATVAFRRHEHAQGSHVPVIAMTAHAMKGDRETCLEMGMDAYVSKPIRAKDLCDMIEHFAHAAAIQPGELRASVNGPAYDRAAALEGAGGDTAVLKELARDFLEESAALMQQLNEAIRHGDAASLRRAAHTLKSTAAIFGAATATAIAFRLEQMGQAGNLAGAGDTYAELSTAVERLTAELRSVAEDTTTS